MADGSVNMLLRLEAGQAIMQAEAAATAARDLAAAERDMATAAREAEAAEQATAAALYRLQTIAAAVAGPTQASALAFQRNAAEIYKLGQASGDAALAEKALADLIARRASDVQRAADTATTAAKAEKVLASAGAELTASTGSVRYGFINLGNQLSDITTQLAMGTNPFTILIQQGPQVVGALAEIGGKAGLVSGLTSALSAAAPFVVALSVAASAGAAAWSVYGNAAADAADSVDGMNQRLADLAAQTGPSNDAIVKGIAHWKGVADDLAETQGRIAVLTGATTEADRASAEATQKVAEASRAALLEESKRVQTLRQSLEAADALSRSDTASATARATASATAYKLRAEYDEANKTFQAHKALVDATADAHGSLAQATAGATAASKDATSAAKAEAEARRLAREAIAAEEEAYKRLIATASTDYVTAMAKADAALLQSRGAPDDAIQRARSAAATDQFKAIAEQAEQASKARAAADAQALTDALLIAQADAAQTVELTKQVSLLDTANKVRSVAQSASSAQGVLSAVGSSSPYAAAIIAVVQAIANLDDTLNGLHDIFTKFWDSLGDLPTIISNFGDKLIFEGPQKVIDFVPKFLQSFTSQLPKMITQTLEMLTGGNLISKLIEMLIVQMPKVAYAFVVTLLDPNTWIQAGKDFVKGIKESWTGIFDNFGSGNSGASVSLPASSGGSSGSGGTKSVQLGASSSRTSRGGASSVVVHFNAPVLGLGPDGSRAISDQLARNTAWFKPA